MKKVVYKDRWMRLEREEFEVRKKKITFTRLVESNVVVILPITLEGKILIERHYRHALKKYVLEIPAGTIEKGETPSEAAKRELQEELGYTADKLRFMFKVYTAPGRSTRTAYFYYAKNLKDKSERRLDSTEIISSRALSFSQFDSMIRRNKICDFKTIAAFLYYKKYVE